jgi:hypothetical protein
MNQSFVHACILHLYMIHQYTHTHTLYINACMHQSLNPRLNIEMPKVLTTKSLQGFNNIKEKV